MQPPGWYGKIAAIGDFAHRRLEPDFVTAWDAWLQACVAESQRTLGSAWLERYLTAPVWRFLLTPGLMGARGWVGILLPSVDRVGRYFPLTVCVPIEGAVLDRAGMADLASWYDKAEAAARSCLAHDATLDDFEEQLHAVGLPPVRRTETSGAGSAVLQRLSPLSLPCNASGPDLGTLADELLANALSGYSLWWQAGGAAFLNVKLPAPSRYTEMIDQAPAP